MFMVLAIHAPLQTTVLLDSTVQALFAKDILLVKLAHLHSNVHLDWFVVLQMLLCNALLQSHLVDLAQPLVLSVLQDLLALEENVQQSSVLMLVELAQMNTRVLLIWCVLPMELASLQPLHS